MKRTILIPTDFSVQSLQVFKKAMSGYTGEPARILVLHGMILPNSIHDLLFLSQARLIESLKTDEFMSSCSMMKNRFQSKIESLHLDIFTGVTMAAFRQYLDANRIDEAFVPVNYKFLPRHKRSFDVVPYILKSNLAITEVRCEQEVEPVWMDAKGLETLFFNN